MSSGRFGAADPLGRVQEGIQRLSVCQETVCETWGGPLSARMAVAA